MNARFLRDEAARFRGMAEDTDRDATRLRLLAMAADYEARAKAAAEEPASGPAGGETGGEVREEGGGAAGMAGETTGTEPDEGASEPTEATTSGTLKIKPVRRTAAGLKETVMVERRPLGRPRRD